jgi:hypothetical protein
MTTMRFGWISVLLVAVGCGGATSKSSNPDGGGAAGATTGAAGGAAGVGGGAAGATTGAAGGAPDAAVQADGDAGVTGAPDADTTGAFIVSTQVEYGADDLVEGPLAGVVINVLAAPTCATVVASGTSGADGLVTIKVTPGQSYCLAFSPPAPPAGATWLSMPSQIPAVRPQSVELVFETDAPAPASALANGNAAVLVTVQGAGPLAGATVTFGRAKSEHCPDLGSACPNCQLEYCIGTFVTVASPVTKSDGTASVALAAGRYQVQVTPPAGWVSPWPRGFTSPSWGDWIRAGKSVQINLELGPPGQPPTTP